MNPSSFSTNYSWNGNQLDPNGSIQRDPNCLNYSSSSSGQVSYYPVHNWSSHPGQYYPNYHYGAPVSYPYYSPPIMAQPPPPPPPASISPGVYGSQYTFPQYSQSPAYGKSQKYVANKITNCAPMPAVSQIHFCEACDKEFHQLDAYNTHIGTHEKCTHPGCEFSATRKVVSAHYHSKHGTYSGTGYKTIDVEGQKFRVLLGTSPEEVEQWRAERRSKFPTKSNIEKKKEETARLVEAGGISEKDRLNRKRKQRTDDRNKFKKGKLDEQVADAVTVSAIAVEDKSCLDRDAKELELKNEHEQSVDSMDKSSIESNDNQSTMESFCSNDLLLANSENNSINTTTADPAVCHSSTKQSKGNKSSNGNRSSNASGRATGSNGILRDEIGRVGKKSCGLFLPNPLVGGKEGSLYRKLIEDEIYAEENIILQCLHFLAHNNFLQ